MMGRYSIKELEKLSGIKAHTIRIWEKRYQLVNPERTESNIRVYSDYDLKKIMNVSLLNNDGIKISVIAGMTDHEVNEKVNELSQSSNTLPFYVDRLIACMLDLEEQAFEDEIEAQIKHFGFEKTMVEVVYPFLQKIGILWRTGSITPAHEHFISNLIRQRITVAIAKLPIPSGGTRRAILFLPENEMHEIALLFYHYLLRKRNIKTYYLGQTVPHEDLKIIYAIHKPHYLVTSLTSFPAPQDLNSYLVELSDDFPDSVILASGALLRNVSFRWPKNLTAFESVQDLIKIIES